MFHIFAGRGVSNSSRTGGKSRLIVGRFSPPFLGDMSGSRLQRGLLSNQARNSVASGGPTTNRAAEPGLSRAI